ncbi:PAS domain S-box-containing protein [Enhydrobacter aerosaccus]|uniref:Blue-light-activated histidine kinase n=1 Tax=Enhydrobacter aerosaccus TaxID=225324 RepID=A0A1T4TGE6_9HYPH|nr:PAS domain-containing protein [Enhydrobacter aerosaccus]SKA39494.1 PAS domain S-box-containing protein [Enhydrobacter aerosaccus]
MPTTIDAQTALDTILGEIDQPFYAVDGSWRITHFNAAAAAHFGRHPDDVIGRKFWEIFAEDRHSERARALLEVMDGRRTLRGEGASMMAGRWVSYCMFPLGQGIGVMFRDVSDRQQARLERDEAVEALRKRTIELETVLEAIPTAVWFSYDRELRHLTGNRQAAQLLHLGSSNRFPSLSNLLEERRPYSFYRDGQEVPADALPMQRAVRGEEVMDELLELRFESGEARLLLMRAMPLRSPTGEIQGAVCAAADVTERHRYEEHLKLLLNELNHRVKNMLAIVQSIAALTLKNVDPAARRDFEQRLLTLSAVHSLLTDANWEGVQLQALARGSLRAHFDTDRERIRFVGEVFRLRPKSAVALSIALNELGTNALKYGALSVPAGHVTVSWTALNGRFHLRWEEQGGPAVVRPTRLGFGARMIERGLPAELQGETRIEYRPEGLVCTIDAPLETIRERPLEPGREPGDVAA